MFKKNKDFKEIICFVVFFIATCLVSGLVGYKLHKCNCKVKKEKSINFFQHKLFGKKFSKNETVILKKTKQSIDECVKKTLNADQQKVLQNIVDEVLELAKDNNKVSFQISGLQSVKNNKKESNVVIKKIRKCFKTANKALTKQEKKDLRNAIKKQSVVDNIRFYNGIK
jgi:paraquat-inducible protein B